ncbi:hypothetical protein ILYODFUR_012621 [Ilyodon furcidens]|uniref:Sushi domain-containing protein n=1 Tax=Ilyodon furcidens TaxID=33524 RepID=A0ABV0TUB6_9TELE
MNFICKTGFQLNGAQQITCGPNGQWQPQPPQCLPSPDKSQKSLSKPTGGCDAPLTVRSSNANLVDKFITMTSFSSGDKVYYSCNVGYSPAGGSRIRKCDNGKWTPLRLKCERKLCGHAGEILNGQFVYTGVEFGDTATAECNAGYILVGRATRHCMSNGWDGRSPVCEAVECQEPVETNAEWKHVQEPPYTYRNVIRYQCRVGSLVGPSEIWCTENGTWSSSPPHCKVITCPSPNVSNALWINSQKQTYHPMETIDSFICRYDYVLTGPRRITCGWGGQWMPGLPQCQPRPRKG